MIHGSSVARGREKGLIVQQSFPRPRATTNPYLRLLAESIGRRENAVVLPFSWRSALLARYDVFHVHWPEILVKGASRPKTLVREILTLLLVVRLIVTRTPLVRTLHNVGTHEGLGSLQRMLVSLLVGRTTLVIRLNDSTPVVPGVLSETIPHGHYRDWFSSFPDDVVAERGHIAYVGLIRPYKGVEDLLRAFRGVPGPVRLTAAGRATDPALEGELRLLAARDDRVELDLRYIDDDDLVAAVRCAELVVLPHREMHNSGSALTALSLGRPVLVPGNAVTDLLADEVGEIWIQRYEGILSADDIVRALAGVEGISSADRPDLSKREWDDAGARHVAAYRRAIDAVGARRTTRRRAR